MNTDSPQDPRDEMEARLTALVLGELPAEQAAELRERIGQDAKLRDLFHRLEKTAALLRETASAGAPPADPAGTPKLSRERRDILLARFKTVRAPVMPRLRWSQWVIPAAAALLVGFLLIAAVIPGLGRAKSRAQNVTPLPGISLGSVASLAEGVSDMAAPSQERLSEMAATDLVPTPKAEPELASKRVESPATLKATSDTEARRRFMARYGLKSQPSGGTPTLAGGFGGAGGGGGVGGAGSVDRLASTAQLADRAAVNGVVTIDPGSGEPLAPDEGVKSKEVPVAVVTAMAAAPDVTFAVPVQNRSELPPAKAEIAPAPLMAAGAFAASPSGDALAANAKSKTQVEAKGAAVLVPPSSDTSVQLAVNAPALEQLERKVARADRAQTGYEVRTSLKGYYADDVTLGFVTNAQRGEPALNKEQALAWGDFDANGTITVADAVTASRDLAASADGRKLVEVPMSKARAVSRVAQEALPFVGKPSIVAEASAEKKLSVQGIAGRELTQVEEKDKAVARPAPPPPIPQPEMLTRENRFSTFSLNVSDVSFKLAAASLEKGQLPDVATIRSEEFLNAFDYHDPEPGPGAAIAFAWEIARSPFAHNRDLVRFSIKTAAQGRQSGRPLNLVVLLDNSGSMERADRVRIIQSALKTLGAQLQPQDRLSIVLFSRTARLWVDGVAGNEAAGYLNQAGALVPQGGTNLEEAMNLAYQTALRHYLANGINRVILLTDGAANLGNVDPPALKEKVEVFRKQGIALDCFGIGWEGFNDELMESLARNGDGRYGFINTPEEAGTDFISQLAGALRVAASDVKVQVEFNPDRVNAFRQIGYARHQLTKEQFRDNTVDAAEIGAAESGNALYSIEVNPSGLGPVATLRVRYKVPGTSDYKELEWLVPYNGPSPALAASSPAMRLAVTASAFSEWLANNPYAGEVTPDVLLKTLEGVPQAFRVDNRPKQLEWMIRQSKSVAGQ